MISIIMAGQYFFLPLSFYKNFCVLSFFYCHFVLNIKVGIVLTTIRQRVPHQLREVVFQLVIQPHTRQVAVRIDMQARMVAKDGDMAIVAAFEQSGAWDGNSFHTIRKQGPAV